MTDAPAIKQNANGIWMLEGEQLWDSDILPVCLEHIKEGDTVIDAGAWIGGHTMAYAEKVGVTGDVTAIEPNPYAFECLECNTKQFPQVTRMMTGLWDDFSAASFSVKKGWMDSGHVGEASKDYIPDAEKSFNIALVPLDNCKLAPNFIKIDVEGCELKVLKGAVKTIEKFRPKMVIEINNPALERQGNASSEIFDWLLRKGYDWKKIGTDYIFNILAISE